jgi:cytochrome c
MKSLPITLGIAALLIAPSWAMANDDDAILKLASDSGCTACHQVEPLAAPANGKPLIGPPWRDIAARYRSVKGAQQTLTATVMTGSSPSSDRSTAYESHWTGKVRGEFMPSHRVVISEADAARLVAWILAQDGDH